MEHMNLVQGSIEWSAYRAQHFNASDAPAMMGCSSYKTRQQLIHEIYTGVAPEVDAGTQKRFDYGHVFEALARPLAQEIIGDELFPVVGRSGLYSASFDGITMMEEVAFEHKTLNATLRLAFDEIEELPLKDQARAGYLLPLEYRAQMEHQAHVSGAGAILFMASKWELVDKGGMQSYELVEEKHVWYTPDAELRARLIAGWEQFAIDLASYSPAPAAEPAPVGRTPENLPALRIEVTGAVTASNLDAFKEHAFAVFAGINRKLETDQDFADAEQTVKWCKGVEDRLDAAQAHAMSQAEPIDAMMKAIEAVKAEARKVRLGLAKSVDVRKQELREDIVGTARRALADYVGQLESALRPTSSNTYIPAQQVDFAGAIKGKRSLDAMRDAVDTMLVNAKVAATSVADRIQINLLTISNSGHVNLFPDMHSLVQRDREHVALVVKSRIADHELEVQAREKAAAEAAERRAQQAIEEAKAKPAPAPIPVPAAEVQRQPIAAAPSGVRIKLGDVCQRLGFTVTADFLATLGFKPVATDRASKLYAEEDFDGICRSLVSHIDAVRTQVLQAA